MMIRHSTLAALMVLLSGCAEKYEFEDYEQILPRGSIAAITDPQYVTADEADISDDSYVLGVVIDGQARAFSLNILSSHEVVNDRVGELSYAAVW
jgi:hypothetical protein